MKLLLFQLVKCACVLFLGFIAFVALELVMFSADLRQREAAVPFYTVLCLIMVGVVWGLIRATKDPDTHKNGE